MITTSPIGPSSSATDLHRVSLPNGVTIEVLTGQAGPCGLGAIQVGPDQLRDGRIPMFCEIASPDGRELVDVALRDLKPLADGGVHIAFTGKVRCQRAMEWMLHASRQQLRLHHVQQKALPAAGIELGLELRPIQRRFGKHLATGFSYQYHYVGEHLRIYQLLDSSTWAPGGTTVGSEILQRNCFVPSRVKIEQPSQAWSTEWYLPSCRNPNIVQLVPLQAELNGFTFLSGPTGTLITWATRVSHIRSLVEKPNGSDLICHWHQHCADLAGSLTTVPMEVLWIPGELSTVERFNLHERVRETVYQSLHDDLGLKQERVTTYGRIEEWGNPDFPRYTAQGLPKLLDAGMKTVYVANHFTHNQNTFDVQNMCCTIDHRIDASIGSANMQVMGERCRAVGAKLEMWINTYISDIARKLWRFPEARVLGKIPRDADSLYAAAQQAEEPIVRNQAGWLDCDHYSGDVACLNHLDPVIKTHLLSSWKRLHDEAGVDGIFNDSSWNLSMDKFHFSQNPGHSRQGATSDQLELLGSQRTSVAHATSQIRSMFRPYLDLWVEIQRMGMHICGEDLGVFGVHHHGPPTLMRLDCFPLWSDCLIPFDPLAVIEAQLDPRDVFFRGIAYRNLWAIHWDICADVVCFPYSGVATRSAVRGDFDLVDAWHIAIFKAFNTVEKYLYQREILPDETGVLYQSGTVQVLWAFADGTHPLAVNAHIRDVLSGQVFAGSSIAMRKHHIYVITVGDDAATIAGGRP